MRNALFHLRRRQGVSLQTSIREMIIDALLDGRLPSGEPLPSCRALATSLQVSRNTVAQAYQALGEDGLIESAPRRGFFVTQDLGENSLWQKISQQPTKPSVKSPAWLLGNIKNPPSRMRFIEKPQNWHSYKYPFLYGQVDRDLFPINAWRECSRQAMAVKNLELWTGDALNDDDPQLIDYIRSRLLPRRGIGADEDNILITLGAQNALYLIASLFASSDTRVGVEDPGYPDVRHQFSLFTRQVKPLPIDSEGLMVSPRMSECDIVYTTPSYQYPSGVTMSLERRNALLATAATHRFPIIEDDYECESDFENTPQPALKALDESGQVIYLGSLSKNLFPALRLGYVVADADIIREIRYQRRLVLRHAPMNSQRTAALFLGLGYHQSFYSLLQRTMAHRRHLMQEALKAHMRPFIKSVSFGMTGVWLALQDGLRSRALLKAALQRDIIIESGDVFFAEPGNEGYIRLGFSSIPDERITEGIALLAEVCAEEKDKP